MIEFACVCGKKMKVDDDWQGKKVRCRQCQQISIVPSGNDLFADIDQPSDPRPEASEQHQPQRIEEAGWIGIGFKIAFGFWLFNLIIAAIGFCLFVVFIVVVQVLGTHAK